MTTKWRILILVASEIVLLGIGTIGILALVTFNTEGNSNSEMIKQISVPMCSVGIIASAITIGCHIMSTGKKNSV